MKAWHSASPYRVESRMREIFELGDLQKSGHFLRMICCVNDWINFTSKCFRRELPCLCTSTNNDLGPFVFENSMPEIIWFEENFVIMLELKKKPWHSWRCSLVSKLNWSTPHWESWTECFKSAYFHILPFPTCFPCSSLSNFRLGICQKNYTTQFSGERILHTEKT